MSRDYEKAADIDDNVDADAALTIAVQKFMNTVAGTDDDGDVGVVEATYRALDEYEQLAERCDELEKGNEELRDRLDALGDIGQEKTSKEQKIASIVTYADNVKEPDQDGVTILPKVIKGVADVSRRYAYDLVDSMVEEYGWAHDPSQVTQYGSMEKDTPQRGVLIDFEGVHGESVSVNKFTTRSAQKEVAD